MSDFDEEMSKIDSPLELRLASLEEQFWRTKIQVEALNRVPCEGSSIKQRSLSQKHSDNQPAEDILGVQIGSALRSRSREIKVSQQHIQSQFGSRVVNASIPDNNRKPSVVSVSRSSMSSSHSLIPKGILKMRDSMHSSNSQRSSSNSTEKKVKFKAESIRNNQLLHLK